MATTAVAAVDVEDLGGGRRRNWRVPARDSRRARVSPPPRRHRDLPSPSSRPGDSCRLAGGDYPWRQHVRRRSISRAIDDRSSIDAPQRRGLRGLAAAFAAARAIHRHPSCTMRRVQRRFLFRVVAWSLSAADVASRTRVNMVSRVHGGAHLVSRNNHGRGGKGRRDGKTDRQTGR